MSDKIEQVLDILVNIQKRLMAMESKMFHMGRQIQELRTYAVRSHDEFKKGMKACQKSFLMNCSAQYELREELSDYAGTNPNFDNDISFRTLTV